jgi:hypothetical protein
MSRFSSFFDALSDKKARFLAEKQVVNDLIFDFYFNALQGKNHFDAVVISGGNSGNSAQTIEGEGQDLIAIKVRPIDIQGLALPDPCSKVCKGQSESYRAYLYALHPTAYSDPNNTESNTTAPAFGSIVKCYFEDRKRFRQLRWTSEGASAEGNHNFDCEELGKLVGNFDGATFLGDIETVDQTATYLPTGEAISNGKLPSNLIESVDSRYAEGGKKLLSGPASEVYSAVRDFDKLAKAFQIRFKTKIKLTSGYRSFDQQVAIKRKKTYEGNPNEAATPGTSNHGWGVAFDYDTTDKDGKKGFDSETYKWLKRYGPKYGWKNPFGEDSSGKLREPWHWEWIRKDFAIRVD